MVTIHMMVMPVLLHTIQTIIAEHAEQRLGKKVFQLGVDRQCWLSHRKHRFFLPYLEQSDSV